MVERKKEAELKNTINWDYLPIIISGSPNDGLDFR